MTERFERVSRHLYKRSYDTDSGPQVLYYARFICRLKKKRRLVALGADLSKAKEKLDSINGCDVDRYDFDLDSKGILERRRHKEQAEIKRRDGKASPFTFDEWIVKYPTFDDVKHKRSLADDLRMIRLHLKPFFGSCLLTEISRETLTRYIDHRECQKLIRGRTGQSKNAVKRGTISNELSLLQHMLRVAVREGYKALVPSFDGLIKRTERGGRALTADEQAKALAVYSPWMRRLAEFALETCLSEGDILRLTEDMVDRDCGVIVPEGGRKKSKVYQVSPLTQRGREILDEIKTEKKAGLIVPNVAGLIFVRSDGSPITKDMIHAQIEKAIRAGIKKFTFHNYRNTALKRWRKQGISVDAVMRAGGWKSTQMYKRYLDMNENDIAEAFGTSNSLENGNTNGNNEGSRQHGGSVTS